MDQSKYKDVVSYIEQYIYSHSGAEISTLSEETNFVEQGLINSFETLALIMDLESQYVVKFQATSLASDSIQTIGGLAKEVLRQNVNN